MNPVIRRTQPTTLTATRAGVQVGRWRWEALDGSTAVMLEFDCLEESVELDLAKAAVECFRIEGYRYVQLPIPEGVRSPVHLEAAGFRDLTTLLELSRANSDPPVHRSCVVRLEPIAALSDSELGCLWQETLIGTLDCPELNDCLGPTGLPAGFADPRSAHSTTSFAAEINDAWVGLIIGEIAPSLATSAILYLGVTPSCRRIGTATALLAHLLASSEVVGTRAATITVDVRNLPALRLYQRHGFRSCGSYRAWAWINSSPT